jgi:hypothetical protein
MKNEVERDLSFEIASSSDLTKMLTGVLMDVRRGLIPYEMAKSITIVADKLNRNNINAITYKNITKSKSTIEFFEDGMDKKATK